VVVIYDPATLYAEETTKILRYKENSCGAGGDDVIEKVRIAGRAVTSLALVAGAININALFPGAVIRTRKGSFT
jgi:hypothetical protein